MRTLRIAIAVACFIVAMVIGARSEAARPDGGTKPECWPICANDCWCPP